MIAASGRRLRRCAGLPSRSLRHGVLRVVLGARKAYLLSPGQDARLVVIVDVVVGARAYA